MNNKVIVTEFARKISDIMMNHGFGSIPWEFVRNVSSDDYHLKVNLSGHYVIFVFSLKNILTRQDELVNHFEQNQIDTMKRRMKLKAFW